MCSDWGVNLQPKHVPWPGIKPVTFWCTGRCSNQLSHLARDDVIYLICIIIITTGTSPNFRVTSGCPSSHFSERASTKWYIYFSSLKTINNHFAMPLIEIQWLKFYFIEKLNIVNSYPRNWLKIQLSKYAYALGTHCMQKKKKNVQDAGETKGNKMQPPSLEAMSPKSTSVGPEERLQHALYRDKHAEGHGASSAGWNKSRDPWGYTNCTIDARNPQTTACQCHASLG